MARNTTRYGRSQPTQSQRPTQAQGRRRQAVAEERESSAAEEEVEEDEEEEEEIERGVDDEQDDLTRKSNMLVRLALFNEHKRTSLKRDEINKKVLNGKTRDFKTVFSSAQDTLRRVFGMELVELMSRVEMEKEQNGTEVHDGENATGLKKKAAVVGSKAYIVRSILDADIIEAAARTDEHILEDEIFEFPDEDIDPEEGLKTYGSIISWSEADQLGAIGILYVVLALIMVSGGILTDLDLRKHLKSLRLLPNAHIDLTTQSTHKSLTVDAYLASLVRQNYLDKVKVGPSGAPRPTQGKRGRQGAVDEESGASFEWKWGSRAQSEVGELAIGRFIAEFLVERTLGARAEPDEGEEEEEDQGQRNGRGKDKNNRGVTGNGRQRRNVEEEKEKMLETMMKSVARAAGGKLNDIR